MEEKNNKDEDENVNKEKNSKIKTIFIGIMLILIYFDACGLFLLLKVKSNDFISAKYKQEIKIEKNNTSENLSNSIESLNSEASIQENITQSINESSIEINEDESKVEVKSSSSDKKESSSSGSLTSSSSKSSSVSSSSSKVNSSSTQKLSSSSIKSSSAPARKIINVVEEKELKETTEKYGVKINTYNIISYNVYNDGTKEIRSTRTQTEYDRSNFSATTNDLKAEAQTARNINAGMISKAWQITNSYRKEANEKAVDNITDRKDLVLDENLCLAASVRAVEMAYTNKMTHTRPNGSVCFTVLKDLGISYYICGENIVAWQNSADAACKTWKNSPGHYSNMISPSYGKIGIGVYKAGGGYFWAQIFTN